MGEATPLTSNMVFPISAGDNVTVTPASFRDAIFSSAPPLPPAMIAPACPILLPGGAVSPAMNDTTGLALGPCNTEVSHTALMSFGNLSNVRKPWQSLSTLILSSFFYICNLEFYSLFIHPQRWPWICDTQHWKNNVMRFCLYMITRMVEFEANHQISYSFEMLYGIWTTKLHASLYSKKALTCNSSKCMPEGAL